MRGFEDWRMDWYCVIIAERTPRPAGAVAFLSALRSAYDDAGQPEAAKAFVNRGSASRHTFLLSPEAATLAPALLRRHDAMACPRAPDLKRYAPLPL